MQSGHSDQSSPLPPYLMKAHSLQSRSPAFHCTVMAQPTSRGIIRKVTCRGEEKREIKRLVEGGTVLAFPVSRTNVKFKFWT